jgi:hypothetical protein
MKSFFTVFIFILSAVSFSVNAEFQSTKAEQNHELCLYEVEIKSYPWSTNGCDTANSSRATQCCQDEHGEEFHASCLKGGRIVGKPNNKSCASIGAKMICLETVPPCTGI